MMDCSLILTGLKIQKFELIVPNKDLHAINARRSTINFLRISYEQLYLSVNFGSSLDTTFSREKTDVTQS